ncbi:MAG: KEOPS complex N(6)-L-threonylcarbamoyladenine synthase Kae1 [Candidatus Bathyarchaeia archaeon]
MIVLGKPVLCLGIESTAHTFGVSVASSDGAILEDVTEVYKPAPGAGIHPRDAAQHHSEVAARVVSAALEGAGVRPRQIGVVAFSMGPGLGPVLRVGATVARALAHYLKRPLVGVNHAVGHIEIASLTTGAKDPLVVLVSGGHTALAAFSQGRWRIFGETEDITVGNLFDMFAREIGYGSPGGGVIEEFASRGSRYVDLPYTVKGNDVAFSGLLTAAVRRVREGAEVSDVCFSLQEVAFAMLTEAAERCLAHIEKRELLLTGGVAANKRLQAMMKVIAKEHDARFEVVEKRFSADCGAQIAWTGTLAYSAGETVRIDESSVRPRWRLDMVEIPWREG